MTPRVKSAGLLLAAVFLSLALCAEEKKAQHPFDVYDHEMHNAFFEGAEVACETCHADPESFGDRAKVNPMGCHLCHNSPKPILPATQQCALCHPSGPPKPKSHRADWIARHQIFAKQDPASCQNCHANKMFCIDCHRRRDTVQTRMHRRNFRFFHSGEGEFEAMKRALCISLLLFACGATTSDGENFGDLLVSASGLTLTEAEHRGGWGRSNCTACHNLENIHLVDHSGTGVNITTIHNNAIRDGESGCASCHGTNGVP